MSLRTERRGLRLDRDLDTRVEGEQEREHRSCRLSVSQYGVRMAFLSRVLSSAGFSEPAGAASDTLAFFVSGF